MTVRELLNFGERELEEAGVPDSRTDARLLLESVSGLDGAHLFLEQDEPVRPEWESAYREGTAKRKRRIPLQHIVGETEFMGLPFQVDGRVMIPRQDTETLVEAVLAWEAENPLRGRTVLDLCTGSGCIAVSLEVFGNFSQVTGSDISEEALEVAEANARRNGCERAEFCRSDLLKEFDGKRFALITANPPYIPTAEIGGLMPEVRDYDPHLALDGGEDGLLFYRRLAQELPGHLIYGGRVFLEIGWNQAEAVTGLLREAGFRHMEVRQDDAGCDRVVTGEWKCLTD